MKAQTLREHDVDELVRMEKDFKARLFECSFRKETERLSDTSTIQKIRRDIARVQTILTEKNKK